MSRRRSKKETPERRRPTWDCRLAFLTSFPLPLPGGNCATRDSLLERVRKQFPDARWDVACLHDPDRPCTPPCADRAANQCTPPLAYDYAVATSFLPLSEAASQAIRLELGRPLAKGRIGDLAVDGPVQVVLTYYAGAHVATVTVNLVLSSCSVDDIICLRQAVYRDKQLEFCNCRHSAGGTQLGNIGAFVWSYVTALVAALDADGRSDIAVNSRGTVIELTRVTDCESPAEAIERYPKELYGLLTSDEGWRYVPITRALDRLEHRWATRDFVTIIPGPGAVLQLNFASNGTAHDYRKTQECYWSTYYGECPEYFYFDPPLAGLNHGSLITLETVMVMDVLIRNALAENQRDAAYASAGRGFSLTRALTSPFRRMREVRERRSKLLRAVQSLEDCSVDELNVLGRMLVEEWRIPAGIDKVRDLLDLTENDLMLEYQSQTNRMVLWLTVLSLLFAGIELARAADWQSICDFIQPGANNPTP